MEELVNIMNNNYIFSAALLLMIAIATLEGVFVLFGFGLSNLFDHLFPNIDLNHNIEISNQDSVSFGSLFNWLNKGGLPLGIWFIVFLTYFGLFGIYLREIFKYVLHFELNMYIAIAMTLIVIAPIIRGTSFYLSKILPRDENYAVSKATFLESVAEIVTGTARKDYPAEARLIDIYNQVHFIMVEPIREDESFKEGEKVYILKEDIETGVYKVIRDPNNLVD